MTLSSRFARIMGAVAAGSVVAALLPMAVAAADQDYFIPDPFTFQPTVVEGIPYLTSEVTGPESWTLGDLTTGVAVFPDAFTGADDHTAVGAFSTDEFVLTNDAHFTQLGLDLTPYTQIDIVNFGGGYGNEFIDIPTGANAGLSDLLVTPMGNFELLGTVFSDLATAS
jgi:hypothetical protein